MTVNKILYKCVDLYIIIRHAYNLNEHKTIRKVLNPSLIIF